MAVDQEMATGRHQMATGWPGAEPLPRPGRLLLRAGRCLPAEELFGGPW